MLFHSLDYQIENLHKSDRANEGGADLSVKNKDGEIAIAVKIKPNQKDRYQLLELSRRKESKKIYVYIQTPTKKFQDSMRGDGKNVQFLDVKKLDDFFIEKNLYFTANLIFENSKTHENIETIKYLLFELWEKSRKLKKEKFSELDKKSVLSLWRLKDVSVTLHKTNSMLKSMLGEPMPFKDEEFNGYFLGIFQNYLDRMEALLESFITYFLEFYLGNTNLVHNSIIERAPRSHWFNLASFNPVNDISTLRKNLEDAIREKELLEEIMSETRGRNLNGDREFEEHIRELAKSNDVWRAINTQIEILEDVGGGIECVIDDIIQEYFEDYQTLNSFGMDFNY